MTIRSAFSALLLAGALTASTFASEQVRDAQTELKTQGFYYGEVTGEGSAETTAAIRRYQIRHGLEVTGTLDSETIQSLGIGGAPARVPQANPPPLQPPPSSPPRVPVEKSDKDFLRREEAKRPVPPQPRPPTAYDPSVVTPPAPLDPPSADFPVLFADTPYATAPLQVQESTLRRAQAALARRGFYRAPIDGSPGPATEEALLSYQRSLRLPLTGRLDLETLSNLRLLPGRAAVPVRGIVRESVPPQRIYRGIIVR